MFWRADTQCRRRLHGHSLVRLSRDASNTFAQSTTDFLFYRWGKFWLAILNVHSWSGLNPTPAELWLLPEFVPFHPWRWWIHTRNVYIPMSWLQGRRFQADLDPLLLSLRQELYVQPYESINWNSCRNNVSPADLYAPHSKIADGLFALLSVYEKVAPNFVRDAALDKAYNLVVMEDENTGHQTIGPVSKAMNMLYV